MNYLNKYRIITCNSVRTGRYIKCSLINISYSLEEDCEIYDIVNDKSLGLVSKKSLIYIGTLILDYASKKYQPETDWVVQELITFCRKWIDDSSSVSVSDMESLQVKIYHYVSNYNLSLKSIGLASYFLLQYMILEHTSYFISAMNQCNNAYCDYCDREPSCDSFDPYREYERQGEVIIEFLKSGKHLFLI